MENQSPVEVIVNIVAEDATRGKLLYRFVQQLSLFWELLLRMHEITDIIIEFRVDDAEIKIKVRGYI